MFRFPWKSRSTVFSHSMGIGFIGSLICAFLLLPTVLSKLPKVSQIIFDSPFQKTSNLSDSADSKYIQNINDAEDSQPLKNNQIVSVERSLKALSKAYEAVVSIESVAIENAASNEMLGRERVGSGVVIDQNGLVLTVGYLIQEAQSIVISTSSGRKLPAKIVAFDVASGLGLVRPVVPTHIAQPVPLGSYDRAEEGSSVTAMIGGEQGEVTTQLLVSKRAFSAYWEYHVENALFTMPPLSNHSGAALFNQQGELIGVGHLAVNDAMGGHSFYPGNMFVSIDVLKPVLQELLQRGTSKQSHRAWLGLISSEQNGRIQVMEVSPKSPAEQAGLAAGDLVLAINGVHVATLTTFYKQLWQINLNENPVVELEVLQGTEIRHLTLKAVDKLDTLRRPNAF